MYHLGRRDPSLDLLALRIAGIRDDAQVGCTRAALPCCTVVHAIIVDRDRRYCLERDARRNGAAALVQVGGMTPLTPATAPAAMHDAPFVSLAPMFMSDMVRPPPHPGPSWIFV